MRIDGDVPNWVSEMGVGAVPIVRRVVARELASIAGIALRFAAACDRSYDAVHRNAANRVEVRDEHAPVNRIERDVTRDLERGICSLPILAQSRENRFVRFRIARKRRCRSTAREVDPHDGLPIEHGVDVAGF